MDLIKEEWVLSVLPKAKSPTRGTDQALKTYTFSEPDEAKQIADYVRRINPLSHVYGTKVTTWIEEEEFEL